MRLPDVIGVGPPRTGSTWLYNALRDSVDMPDGIKEPQFFSTFYDKGIEWYGRHFRYASGRRPVAEISAPYFFHELAPERIKLHIPHCKIIATMRDPVERIHSVYKLARHYGWVGRGTIDEILAAQPNPGGGNRYAAHLKIWFSQLGRENVLVTIYDELRDQPQAYLDRVCDFVGVDRVAPATRANLRGDINSFARAPKNRRLARTGGRFRQWLRGHQAYRTVGMLDRAGVWEFCGGRGDPYPRLTPDQVERLRQRYMPEIEALEDLLSIDLSAWKKPRVERSTSQPPTTRAAAG